MINADRIPEGCLCGWVNPRHGDSRAQWELIRPEVFCPHPDHHVGQAYFQLTLDEQPEWEVEP